MNDFVCIKIVDSHFFSCHCTPIFQLYVCIMSNLKFNLTLFRFLSRYHFSIKTVRIGLNMLTKFHEVTYFNALHTQGPNSSKCKNIQQLYFSVN